LSECEYTILDEAVAAQQMAELLEGHFHAGAKLLNVES